MDPVTLSDATFGLFQITLTLPYLPLSDQTFGSRRHNYYSSKIAAERKRTEAWVNGVRSINVTNLQETFPPHEHDRILNAIWELRHNYEQASSKLESVGQGGKTLQSPDLLNEDYDELEELLNKLTSANDALPPVAHTPSMNSPRSSEKSFQRRSELEPERKATDMIPTQEPIRPPFIPPVRTIYVTTHSTLVTISVRRSDPKIIRSASRLKLWGVGLFEMAIPLDTVFDSDKDTFRHLRQHILRILVDILVWAEQELNKLSNDGHNSERIRDSQSAEQITALLGTDELIPMALESWKDSVDQYEYVQAGHVFNTHYNPVPRLVEILFDLLPALRATRRTYCSRLAEAGTLEDNGSDPLLHQPAASRSVGRTIGSDLATRRSPTASQSFSSGETIFDESYVVSANLKFEKVNDIFKKLDKIAKREGRSSYTSRLQSERESLERLHADRRSRRGVEAKAMGDMSEKQRQLVKKMAEFLKDSSGITNPSVPLLFFRKRQGKDLEKYTMRAESFLSSLTLTNRAMRNIMHGRGQIVEGSPH